MDPLFKKYFPDLGSDKLDQLNALKDIYTEWNDKINVVSRKDIDNLNFHHVIHSLSISKFISFKDGTQIMDLGTGGGFPGIPLAIVFPNCHFNLVDSRNKKLLVVNNIVEELGLKNVSTTHERAENIKSKYHFVVSRAVASLDKLTMWSEKIVSHEQFNIFPNGLLSLKGGDLKKELKTVPSYLDPELIDLNQYFDHPYYVEKHLIYIPL